MNHDALSKALFTLPPVEADLLRIVARGWVHLLDLSRLERLGAEHPSADQTQRIGDLAWRAPFRDGELLDGNRPWLLSPTECQSTHDPEMAERLAEYLGRHLRALRREGILSREGEEPRVLLVVVYDGERRWRRGVAPPGMPTLPAPGGYVVLLRTNKLSGPVTHELSGFRLSRTSSVWGWSWALFKSTRTGGWRCSRTRTRCGRSGG